VGCRGVLVARCELRYILRTVASDFSAEIMGLQVVEHGSDARVVTVTGEIDSLTVPELAAFVTAQLAEARLVVVDLDGVQFLGSAGLAVLFEADELASRGRPRPAVGVQLPDRQPGPGGHRPAAALHLRRHRGGRCEGLALTVSGRALCGEETWEGRQRAVRR